MEHSYTILGGDGNEYGPHPLSTLQSWINEGRMVPETKVRRSDGPDWKSAGDFGELSFASSPVPVVTPPAMPATAASPGFTPIPSPLDPAVLARVKSSAGWFYWITALSAVNTISSLSGSDWRFIVGAGMTEVFNGIGHEIGGAGKLVAVVLDLLFLGLLVFLGVFAGRGHRWAFVVGMVVYLLDAAIFVLVGDWISIAFHAYVLFCLFVGFKAAGELKSA